MASPSNTYVDKRSLKFNILPGTSTACPYVSGATAFVKSFHPTWSAYAIKSALMTLQKDLKHEPKLIDNMYCDVIKGTTNQLWLADNCRHAMEISKTRTTNLGEKATDIPHWR
ncbi:cucumisin [Artemisia annua]|uniref:Cucumisin n=1 Tax=Artemisia annua TaxID=35608 RepID=A0A2U1PXH0_ARTAN|nr:cucumisin [Artemisia annua]